MSKTMRQRSAVMATPSLAESSLAEDCVAWTLPIMMQINYAEWLKGDVTAEKTGATETKRGASDQSQKRRFLRLSIRTEPRSGWALCGHIFIIRKP